MGSLYNLFEKFFKTQTLFGTNFSTLKKMACDFLFPHQPPRTYGKPMWEWVEACADAEDARLELMKLFAKGELDAATRRDVALALLANPSHFARELRLIALNPVLVFDTETTGLAALDVVIQLGYCLSAGGMVIEEYEKVWRGDVPSNPFALKVHKIPNRAVLNSPHDPREELNKFADLARRVTEAGGVVVAHNAQFDVRMLGQTARKLGLLGFDLGSVFCTAKNLKRVPCEERGPTCKNSDVYKFLNGPPMIFHQALNDAKATAYVYEHGLKNAWW